MNRQFWRCLLLRQTSNDQTAQFRIKMGISFDWLISIQAPFNFYLGPLLERRTACFGPSFTRRPIRRWIGQVQLLRLMGQGMFRSQQMILD